MVKKEQSQSLFQRLTKLFKSGPVVKRKLRTLDTVVAVPDKTKSSGALLFQKSLAPTYATITANAYNLSERLMRYQDFQEMEYTPEVAAALDIYADETVAQDDKGKVLHIYSDNEKIKEILEDLFYNTLNTEFNLRSWARNLVKYGDFFLYNDVSPTHGVINAFPIPVNEIEREENYDPNDPFAVRYRWVTLGNRTLETGKLLIFVFLVTICSFPTDLPSSSPPAEFGVSSFSSKTQCLSIAWLERQKEEFFISTSRTFHQRTFQCT
jgi:hypothetical protein